MQSTHIAITGALLFATGCALPEEGALTTTGEQSEWQDPVVASDDSSLLMADSPMEPSSEPMDMDMDMEAPGILGDSSDVERHERHRSKWVCVARHRTCRHRDDRDRDHGRHLTSEPWCGGGECPEADLRNHRRDRDDHDRDDHDRDDHDRDDHDGFEPCDTDYYYATHKSKHRARHKAVHKCRHEHFHSAHKCHIDECYRR